MEFWGVEVKPGESLRCDPGEAKLIHLSQAALGVTKDKGSESIPLYVTVNNQKLVLGTLSSVTFPQIPYDLVFEKEFELSHGSKSATVYFCGYRADVEDKQNLSDDEFSDFGSEEDVPVDEKPNGKPKGTELVEKPKPKVQKEVKPATEKEDDSDESDDSDDSDSDSEDSDDLDDSDDDNKKAMMDALGDDDDDSDNDEDDDGSEDEDEETPTPKNNKKESRKKRPAESASKTPAPEKKAKLVSPAGQKTGGDGKKGGHVATPHPAKQAAKTPANSDKKQHTPKPQTPKSAGSGSVSCSSCSKTFNSEKALESHSKAKHGAAK